MLTIRVVLLFAGVMSSMGLVAQSRPAPASGPPPGPAQQFVIDVVRSAVALPQPQPQDRLRVLSAAAEVILPVSRSMARRYAREGMRIEAESLANGQRPVVSVLAAGAVDCNAARGFLDSVPDAQLGNAEQSLIVIITACPTHLQLVQRKLQGALQQGTVAPRALLAAMEKAGPSSRWSQTQFDTLFASLPAGDSENAHLAAPDYAAVLARMAAVVEKDAAREAGIRFLAWLGNMSDSAPRNLAIDTASKALADVLGQAAYDEALAGDAAARMAIATAGRHMQIRPNQQEAVSTLSALRDVSDRFEEVSQLPSSQRAREAAAHGFAAALRGDRNTADRYFQLAFSAADEVWANRDQQPNATAVIQELTEALAQTDPVAALNRARTLSDPSAQAISMLAVARVVAGQENK